MESFPSALNGDSPRPIEGLPDMLDESRLRGARGREIRPLSKPGLGEAARPRRSQAKITRNIGETISYMKEHLDQPLKAAALAAEARVSLSHFFALFKRQTGSTPIDYFIQLRMQRACELLNATSLSVKEVAAALSYEDPFYFSRVFKHVNQVAPSHYRRKAGGETCRMV